MPLVPNTNQNLQDLLADSYGGNTTTAPSPSIPTSVRLAQLPYFTPTQNQALQALTQLSSPESNLFQTASGQGQGLQNIANPILENLQTSTIPNILARFGNRGQEGSSALNRAVASGLQRATSDLFADRANRQGQASNQLLSYLNTILQSPNVTTGFQQTPSLTNQLLTLGAESLPKILELLGDDKDKQEKSGGGSEGGSGFINFTANALPFILAAIGTYFGGPAGTTAGATAGKAGGDLLKKFA